jgi:archaellum biogenesis ATPase FlaH
MEIEKQRLILSCLASNRDLFALCSGILKPSYFDPSLKKTVKFMGDYFTKYKDVPKFATIRAETGLVLEDVGKIERADQSYVSAEIETFCRERAVTEAILAGPELMQKGDMGKIMSQLKDALSVGLQKDLGLDYFADPELRMVKAAEAGSKLSTGIAELDEAIGGGISRGELMLFAANSGGGKSMTMLNVGVNMLKQGYSGVYISLEMGEEVVARRADSMITNIAQENLLAEMGKAANMIIDAAERMGKFRIKRMPENRTTINTIRSYLLQLEQDSGFRPDFIIVDYLDIMGTTMQISYDNLFVKDKYVTEEVRSLGYDFDAVILSASQLGRAAIEADTLKQSHIQGGISKINTSDYTIGIKQDDLMRAAGEIVFEMLKCRNSKHVGRRLLLGWDAVSLCITSLKGQLKLAKKSKTATLSTSGTVFGKPKDDGILSLMQS